MKNSQDVAMTSSGSAKDATRDAAQSAAERSLRISKALDRARVLPLVGVVVLLPPLAGTIVLEVRVLGIPLAALYLFLVWAGLIAGAWLISRQLSKVDESANEVQPRAEFADRSEERASS